VPTLINKDGSSAVFDSPEEVKAALASGEWTPAGAGGTVEYSSPVAGTTVSATPEQQALMPGSQDYGVAQAGAGFDQSLEGAVHTAYSGMGDQLKGAAEGAASVLTLSASDWALDAAGADTALREKHTVGRKIGEAAAILGTMVAPGLGAAGLAAAEAGEAVSTTQKIGQMLLKTPGGAISEFGAGGKTALARIARTAGEGAAYGLAQASTNMALAEPGVATEHWASELGQGALLGLALGAAGGAVGEGIHAVGAVRAARRGALDLEQGVGKEVIEGLAKSQNELDNVLGVAASENREAVAAASSQISKEHTANLAQRATEVQAEITRMRPAVAEGATEKFSGEYARADKLFEKAMKSGKQQHYIDYLTQVEAMARKAGSPELANLTAAHLTDHLANATAADEHLAGMTVKLPEAPYRKVFDLQKGEKLGPDAFKRLIKLGEKDPKELIKRAAMLTEYHMAAQAAVKGNEVGAARVAEALDGFKTHLDRLVPGETAELLKDPKLLQTILGTAGAEAAIEMIPDGTPGKQLLQLAAAYKLVGGIGNIRGAGMSTLKRIANSIGRRASAGAAAGYARGLPLVKRMGSMASTAVMGGAASGGYEFYNWTHRTFFNGAKAAMHSEATARSVIAGAVERVAKGKPVRARAMPVTTEILDKLLGDPDHPAKTPQAKFKVIQERLSKYAVAPDAANEALYHALKPVAEVSEQVADMMEGVLGTQFSYLQSKLPQDTGTMMLFGKSLWQPTDRELYEFSMHAMGVVMPLQTVDMIADGTVPPQAAEALAATNPEIFTKMQMSLVERADEVRDNSTYNQRISLGLAFQLPLDPTADPRYVAFMQSMHAQKTMDQAAGDSGEGSTPDESYSDAQKLLS
jgi:hypothetical protein